ncbi:MAG: hypothetical protein EHM93_18725 [Bacteroidales bacterium]|nr:MAG: hypothetical protein EHM93_18725 [Bacteroidales bacterium]
MLSEVIHNYFPKSRNSEVIPFGNGHINDTYKLAVSNMPQDFILQRINTDVFKNPQGIVDTHLKLQKSIRKYSDSLTIAELIPNTSGNFLTIDQRGNAWRVTTFINDSYTIDVVDEDWQAFEAGFGYGWFAKACSEFNASDFKEAITDFHRLSFRVNQLNEAIHLNKAGRLESVKDIVNFYKEREAKLSKIESYVDEGIIPLRVVHNDTKINNLLFRNKKVSAVIDLDTVGPGILFYDYGDALRTSANSALEDEKDLSKVHFNIQAFEAFTKGYITQVDSIITKSEIENFHLAPILMTYIIGIRFLTDYLNGDTYYKVAYPDHNIDRSKVQKKLIESIEYQENHIKNIIEKTLLSVHV